MQLRLHELLTSKAFQLDHPRGGRSAAPLSSAEHDAASQLNVTIIVAAMVTVSSCCLPRLWPRPQPTGAVRVSLLCAGGEVVGRMLVGPCEVAQRVLRRICSPTRSADHVPVAADCSHCHCRWCRCPSAGIASVFVQWCTIELQSGGQADVT
jgi:hypothetical protein